MQMFFLLFQNSEFQNTNWQEKEEGCWNYMEREQQNILKLIINGKGDTLPRKELLRTGITEFLFILNIQALHFIVGILSLPQNNIFICHFGHKNLIFC